MRNRLGRFTRIALVLLLALTTITQSGCWSSYEINDLAIITALGIDRADDGAYRISALVVRTNALFKSGPTGGAGGSQQTPAMIMSSTGPTLFGAMRHMSAMLAKRMYWAHLQVIIFGEKAVQDNIAKNLDVLIRQHEFRNNIDLLVTKGRAEDILNVQPQLEGTLGAEIVEIIHYTRLTSTTVVNDVSHIVQAATSSTKDAFTGVIVPSKEAEGDVRITNGQKESGAVALQGSAVFKQGHLAGWLGREETRGVLWVMNKVKGGIVQLNCDGKGQGDKSMIAVELLRVHSGIKPRLENGEPQIDLQVNLDAEVGEVDCEDFEVNTQSIQRLNRQLEAKVKREIQESLSKVKDEWQSDIFGFGEAIYHKDPKAWSRLAPEWRKGALKKMKVNVQVAANIWRTGTIHDPNRVDEER